MTAAPATLTDEQRIAWLRLIRTDTIGPATFRELINHFGSAAAAIDAVPDLARRGGRTVRVQSVIDAERELAAAERIGARVVAIGESDYPPWLRAIDGAPPILAIRGDGACLARPIVAVVGSRNASIAGSRFAMQIAAGLGAAGFGVASGLARGIDAAAHRAALATGTVAVYAGGLDHPYPPENVELAEEIVAKGGALISEMPMGHVPRGKDFPRRNRIISGISVAVVVVEGALRSGTLITARCAADQGRLVFAVPGSPLDPRSGATNLLIKEGAAIVTSIDDIVSEIRPMLTGDAPPPVLGEREEVDNMATEADDEERDRIVDAIGRTPVDVDAIIRFTGLKPAVVRLVLLELELAGRLEHHQGGRVSIVD
ncbi:MAG: DNA-processing protein DprA [Dongiaceae bacterium]